MTPGLQIRSLQERDLRGFNQAVNAVCRERRFLAHLEGFSLEASRDYLREVLTNGWPHVIAVDAEVVIGWCDIVPGRIRGFRHVGRLGMGVVSDHRRKGIGRRLMAECMVRAKMRALEKLELEVFSDNAPAIELYGQFGFVREGLKKHARKLDGGYQDILLMGRMLGPSEDRVA
nr:GNAT family N-acetyltransferase [Gammaproteobacteria bacterium]